MAQGSPGYLGPYRLLNVVHTGHAGQIWQAYDDAHQRIVGIKTLLEKARKDREQLHYMHVEYAIGSKLKHPHVIETYSLDTDRGQPYLAMEWFSAPNMKQRLLQNGKGMARLIPKIIDQAADALAYFNQLGWVHRDIKPDNFLVADDGTVKLIDFALAKRARHGLLKWFSRRSKIQGTKSYMSPEQIRGQALDGRADLYSFACTVYELVSGKPPLYGLKRQRPAEQAPEAAAPLARGSPTERHHGFFAISSEIDGQRSERTPPNRWVTFYRNFV